MNTINATREKPTMMPLVSGKRFQTFVVIGKAGMEMPSHHSTKEAIVIIQIGMAELQMPEKKHLLREGDVFIIPAGIEHHLSILSDNFKAVAVMSVDSEIVFS